MEEWKSTINDRKASAGKITVIFLCFALINIHSSQGRKQPKEGHVRDHRHDHDHNETHHGHSKDHLGHRDADVQHAPTSKAHEIHHADFSVTKPGYDLRDRPHGKIIDSPIRVELYVFSDFIETIDESKQEIVASLFLKTRWRDTRLRKMEDVKKELHSRQKYGDTVMFPGEMKEKLWVPDIFVPMARHVTIPTIQIPADSINFKKDHYVEYAALFFIGFKCKMKYTDYPMDEQHCSLDFMSYNHNITDLRLVWANRSLGGERHISTKHFEVTIFRPKKNILKTPELKDVLRIKFHLRRYSSFHLVQTYLPTTMLVFIGWLSLLVPLDFAYGRMVLSVTTLLVLVSIFVTTSQNSPGVNEVKALDVWLFMCICFVFFAIINCIADLRFLSIVEKESQIAAEDEATLSLVGDSSGVEHVYGANTPFKADRDTLIATPTVVWWLRLTVRLERGSLVVYPTLFVLFVAVYWAYYISQWERENDVYHRHHHHHH